MAFSVLAPERPQLKEVQSWGRKEPQPFISIMVGTVPAPEQESLGGWGRGRQGEASGPAHPGWRQGRGSVPSLSASLQTMLGVVHCQAQVGTGSGTNLQAGDRSPARECLRAGWGCGDEQDMEDAHGDEE